MGRRGKLEGCIYERPDGRWSAIVQIGWANGKRQRKFIYGKSREEVARKLRDATKARDDGLLAANDRTTVDQFMRQWLDGKQANLRPSTWTRYDGLYRLHMAPNIGRIPLTKLQPQHLQTFYAGRLATGLSPTSVLQMHRILHVALKQATRWGLVARNVASVVDPPRRARHEVWPLTPVEARSLIAAARGDRLEALFLMALMTGMRKGELLALRWSDVDLARGVASIRRTLAKATGGGFEMGPTKTRGSARSVLLARPVVDALKTHTQRQNQERAASYGAWDELDLVFTNEVGRALDPTHVVRRSFHPLLVRAGIRRIRFHDLRHTAASLLLAEGIHPKIVSEMLGHSQISITLDLYSHVSETMLGQARDTFNTLFGSQVGSQTDDPDGAA